MLKLILIASLLLGLGFAGIAIKIWAKKDGEFDGTCAGKNVKLKERGITCGCGKEGGCETSLDNKTTATPVVEIGKI